MKGVSRILVLLLVVAFVWGCGIPRNRYDEVVQEMSAFQDKAKSLSSQVETLKSEYDKMIKDLASLKAENANLLKENKQLKSEVAKLQAEKAAQLIQ